MKNSRQLVKLTIVFRIDMLKKVFFLMEMFRHCKRQVSSLYPYLLITINILLNVSVSVSVSGVSGVSLIVTISCLTRANGIE